MEAAVRIEGLNVWYGGFQALCDVSVTVPRGAVYAILGPSGCGKSTLLRAINKLILLRKGVRVEGKVEVLGVDVYNSSNSDGVLAKVGMVFQTPNPFPHLSVYDNVAIGPRLHGMAKGRELDELVKWALEKAGLWEEVKDRLRRPASDLSGGQQQRLCIARALATKPELLLMDEPTANLDPLNAAKIEELVKWALEKAGLWEEVKDRLRRPASDLSGGQQQRLCIARALATKPELLLMDEPTANLDPLNAAKIEELVKELSQEITIIIVTHDAEQAKRLASHGALLFMGKVVSEGPISTILSKSYSEILQTLVNGRLAAQKAAPVQRVAQPRSNGRFRLPWK